MIALVVTDISTACTACGACLLTCPEHALRPAPRRPVVLADACTGCGECVEICPRDAITVTSLTSGIGAWALVTTRWTADGQAPIPDRDRGCTG